MTDDEHDYELIMPFVTVVSNGGPHDDDSYVSGWAMGALDQLMTTYTTGDRLSFMQVIRFDNVPQAELIAMKHGYSMTTEGDAGNPYGEPDEWVNVRFTTDSYPSVTDQP